MVLFIRICPIMDIVLNSQLTLYLYFKGIIEVEH